MTTHLGFTIPLLAIILVAAVGTGLLFAISLVAYARRRGT